MIKTFLTTHSTQYFAYFQQDFVSSQDFDIQIQFFFAKNCIYFFNCSLFLRKSRKAFSLFLTASVFGMNIMKPANVFNDISTENMLKHNIDIFKRKEFFVQTF